MEEKNPFQDNKIVFLGDNRIVLADYRYYGKFDKELKEYCREKDIEISGLILKFPDDETKLEFILYWC